MSALVYKAVHVSKSRIIVALLERGCPLRVYIKAFTLIILGAIIQITQKS